MSAAWAVPGCGRDSAGTTACMNTFANVASHWPLVMGYSVQWFGSWSIPLLITSAVYALGSFALLVNPAKNAGPAG
jgi:hypothetical protein